MGSGVHLSYLIAEEILKIQDIPVTAEKYCNFVLSNKDNLFDLLNIRKRMKTGGVFNPERFVLKTTELLRNFSALPDFIVYRQCPSCRQKHFYLADALRPKDLKYKKKLSVKLMPLDGQISCPPIIWSCG